MKPIKVKDYFEIINPEYSVLKVTPLKSLRNYNSESLVAIVASTYKKLSQQFCKHEKKLTFKRQAKLSYMIYMDADGSISFFFMLPNDFFTLYKEKIGEVWKGVTVELVDALPTFSVSSTKFCMTYKKRDAFSLVTDKRNNSLLSAILSATDILEEGDRAAVLYNIYPVNQKYWKASHDESINKLKAGYPVEREKKNKLFLLKLSAKFICIVCDIALNTFLSLFDDKLPPDERIPIKDLDISSATTSKRDAKIVGTQILIMSESEDRDRQRNSASSLCESFDRLTGDNSLVPVPVKTKKPLDYTEGKLKGVGSIITSPAESQSFISLPGRELIEQYKIECISTLETQVPEELQTGYISLGLCTYKGKPTEAFLPASRDVVNFPIVAVGEQGSGKSTLFARYVLSCLEQGEGCFVLDFIKNCELASKIEERITDKSKLITLDLSKFEDLQGFGYDEIRPKSMRHEDICSAAFDKAEYINMLINALTPDEPLSPIMDRFLTSAAVVTLINPDASLRDVIRCLENHEFRASYIENLPDEFKEILCDEIVCLRELDSKAKDGTIDGTKSTKIEGIFHRINLLRKNLRLKTMFSKGTRGNLDLVKAMNEGKCVIIKMPQDVFGTPYIKNTIATYWITKVWSCTLVRGGQQEVPRRFHVLIDEIFQAKTAMTWIGKEEILPQTRKFSLKFVFSCQHLKQIKEIDQTLRSAGASYLLMKGSGKSSFKEFAEELSPFTLDDLESMERFYSLNLINHENGRSAFITHLPDLPKLKSTLTA